MKYLSGTGRIFYGISIAVLGLQSIFYQDFPYMLIPQNHTWIPGLKILAITFGFLLLLAGLCIVFRIKTRPISLLLGAVLLFIFCFYFIPYEFGYTSKYLEPGEWDNGEKELALSAGAFLIAGSIPGNQDTQLFRLLGKLVPFSTILFAIIIASWGVDHFLYAKDVADYIPSWIPNRLFWAYLAGGGLLGFGIGILLRIRRPLMATLLGSMILIWFIILHIPKALASPIADQGGEVTSAFLALAYCGIAFFIAGSARIDHSLKSGSLATT